MGVNEPLLPDKGLHGDNTAQQRGPLSQPASSYQPPSVNLAHDACTTSYPGNQSEQHAHMSDLPPILTSFKDDDHDRAVIAVEDSSPPQLPRSSFWPCVFNLSKVIMGAGMMAVPKAFFLLGWATGTVLMVSIAGLTFFTLAGLIHATDRLGAHSYASLVRMTLGPKVELALQLAVFVNCYIMNMVFLVVIGDILVGTPGACNGIICELTGISHGPLVNRQLVLCVLTLVPLFPLASMHTMEKLAVVNIIGVLANGLFALTTLALAVSAYFQGVLQPISAAPQWQSLGKGPLMITLSLAGIAPVILNCDTCHQSLHPLMPLLRPYTTSNMKALVGCALGVCNVLYFLIGVCCCLTFGAGLHADVLANINTQAIAPLVGGLVPATVLGLLVRVGYLLSLTGSYVLLCYPIRSVIGDVCFGNRQAVERHWTAVTAGLVGTIYVFACFVPSIWGALSLVGSTASTVQAFIVPGLVILAVDSFVGDSVGGKGARWAKRGAAGLVFVVGVLLFMNEIVHEVMKNLTAQKPSNNTLSEFASLMHPSSAFAAWQ
eukprot:jgi/Chrzof1/11375/Cz05g34150.t1